MAVNKCKNCLKAFEAKESFYVNHALGKKIKRLEQYCSKKCYRAYYDRMRGGG